MAACQKRQTSVRRRCQNAPRYIRVRGITYRYQVRTHQPLTEVRSQEEGGVNSPPRLVTNLFLPTYDKRFPTIRDFSAQWGSRIVSLALSIL